MYVRNKLLTDTILAEPSWRHICFAEGDAAAAPGGAVEPPPAEAEELDLGEEPPAGADDDMVEVEIGPDKLKVPKAVKGFVDGVHAKNQTEREAIKAEREAVAQQAARYKETEALRTAVLDEIADARSVEKNKAAIETQMAEYGKLSTEDWMRWNEQDPEAAKKGQMHYQALQMQRGNLQANLETIMASIRTKGGQFEQQQKKAAEDAAAANAARLAQAERDLPAKIKDWSPAKKEALFKVAADTGFSPEELAPLGTDWRVMAVLDDAAKYRAAVARAAKTKAAADQGKADDQPVVEATPKMRTGTGTGSAAPRDDDDGATWLKKRNAEVAAKMKANGGRRR